MAGQPSAKYEYRQGSARTKEPACLHVGAAVPLRAERALGRAAERPDRGSVGPWVHVVRGRRTGANGLWLRRWRRGIHLLTISHPPTITAAPPPAAAAAPAAIGYTGICMSCCAGRGGGGGTTHGWRRARAPRRCARGRPAGHDQPCRACVLWCWARAGGCRRRRRVRQRGGAGAPLGLGHAHTHDAREGPACRPAVDGGRGLGPACRVQVEARPGTAPSAPSTTACRTLHLASPPPRPH